MYICSRTAKDHALDNPTFTECGIMTSLDSCSYIRPLLDQARCDKATELAYLNGKLEQLDHHIRELHQLRSAIVHRTNQLLSPIYALPNEILSYLFCQCVDLASVPTNRRKDVHEAMVLGSVSCHWRRVALGTLELWRTLEFLDLTRKTSLDNISSLIQHCARYGRSLDITVFSDVFDPPEDNPAKVVRPFTTAVFHPDIAPKIKALKVYKPCSKWIKLLPSLSSLHTLTIKSGRDCSLDLGSLPLVRVHLIMSRLKSIVLPPSVQTLRLENVPSRVAASVVYQCPGLIEYSHRPKHNELHIPFTKPLILDDLRKLACSAQTTLGTLSSVQNLQLRSLKTLEITMGPIESIEPLSIITFCDQVSTTLQSLVLIASSVPEWLLKLLFKTSLSGLRNLEFRSWEPTSFLRVLLMLTLGDNEKEDGDREQYLPHLRSLTVNYGNQYVTQDGIHSICRGALDWMKVRKIGKTYAFHLDFVFLSYDFRDRNGPGFWRDDLKREWREYIERSQVEATWNGEKIAC